MDVKEAIEKRRCIRKYQDKEVPENLIKEILEAGRLAPSGCNVQPTRYFIIKDKKTKQRLKQKKAFEQDFVYEAPIIIVLCGNPKDYEKFGGVKYQQEEGTLPKNLTMVKEVLKGKNEERTLRDISIASVFLVLRATELGLGTCYIGLINKNVLKKEFNISKEWILPFVITLGYPAESPKQRPRKDLNELILKLSS
jgi:nitroreductase